MRYFLAICLPLEDLERSNSYSDVASGSYTSLFTHFGDAALLTLVMRRIGFAVGFARYGVMVSD